MRIVREMIQGEIRVSIFHWNNKYLIKFERGPLEQTYKVPEYEIAGESGLIALATGGMMVQCIDIFDRMETNWRKALDCE